MLVAIAHIIGASLVGLPQPKLVSKYKRESRGWSMWWVLRPGDVWRTLATTNYQALESLTRLKSN